MDDKQLRTWAKKKRLRVTFPDGEAMKSSELF